MARFAGQETPTLVVAGVRFMGETAEDLEPREALLMPDLDATARSTRLSRGRVLRVLRPGSERTVWLREHDRGSEKRADWVVTSAIALDVARTCTSTGEIFGARPASGRLRAKRTGETCCCAGACVVHEEFKAWSCGVKRKSIRGRKCSFHPIPRSDQARRRGRLDHADHQAAQALDCRQFIIANRTACSQAEMLMRRSASSRRDRGRGRQLQELRALPLMAMNGLAKPCRNARYRRDEIQSTRNRRRAYRPIDRMLGRRRIVGATTTIILPGPRLDGRVGAARSRYAYALAKSDEPGRSPIRAATDFRVDLDLVRPVSSVSARFARPSSPSSACAALAAGAPPRLASTEAFSGIQHSQLVQLAVCRSYENSSASSACAA